MAAESLVMRVFRSFAVLAVLLAIGLLAPAQRDKRQPLTEAQLEKIREAGIYPDERIHLFATFINEHVDAIKLYSAKGHSPSRTHRLDDELLDVTALFDELASNLDQYGDRKADLRRSLKGLNKDAPLWLDALNSLAPEPAFDLSRKEAIESGRDLADQVAQMFKEQTAYFDTHKDERGQDRAEPK